MGTCINCNRKIPDNSSYCNFCGGKQSQIGSAYELKKNQGNRPQIFSTILLILVIVIVGGILIAWALGSIPNEYKGNPGQIIVFGLSLGGVGLVAWFISLKLNISFGGKLAGCYFFPILGLIIVVTGALLFIIQLFGIDKNPQLANTSSSRTIINTPTIVKMISNLTPTKGPAYISPTKTKQEPDCKLSRMVTLSDVGNKICVKGYVYSAASDNVAYYVKFSSSQAEFYFYSYAYTYPEIKPGVCVQGTGIVRKLGNTPAILLDEGSERDFQRCQ